MNFNLKMACTATLLALGVTAQAADKQRVIVKFSPGQGQEVKALAEQAGGNIKVDLAKHDAFALEVSEKALAGLRNNPNVEYIEEDTRIEWLATNLNNTEVQPFGISTVQADLVSDSNAGNRSICIIDSGYAINHVDLATNNVDGTNQSLTGNWYEASVSHGTHVAGTIAAVSNGSGVVGVNPSGNLDIHVIKMFGDTFNSDLVAGADDCVAAGANVITMSLRIGGYSSTADNAFQGYADDGVLSIAASGNDGNSTKSYPASFDSVMSVGATDSGNMHANFSQYNDQVEISAPGEAILSSVDGDGHLGQLSVGGVDYFANGVAPQNFYNSSLNFDNDANNGSVSGELGACTTTGTTYSCPSMTGKVCVVERGENQGDDTSSTENNYPEYRAVNACVDAGAVGVVVYSNAARPGLQHPFLVDFDAKIGSTPAVSVDRATGLDLVGKVGQAASMAKQGGTDWEYYNGTSMATPHVSGVAALVWSHHPTCSNAEIRQVLTDTALDIDVAGRDDRTGFGLVQAQAALDALNASGCVGAAPAAPSNLQGSANVSGKGKNAVTLSVSLSWNDNASDESGFVVERCVETGKGKSKSCDFASIATLGSNVTSYTDTSVPSGTVKYRVKAYGAGGDSAYSNEVSF